MRQLLHLSDVHCGPHFLPAVAAGAVELAARRRPDVVVVSGDLTQRAKPAQLREARAFLDRFEAIGIPTLAVPGNHDVPLYRKLFLERLLDPYGAYRRHFSAELEPVFEDDELLLIGLNTAHAWTLKDGRLSRERLRRLALRLSAAPPGRARIVVAHHHFVPPPRFDNQRVTRNAVEAVDLMSRWHVELVLSGHLHQAWVGTTEAYYPSGRRPVLLLHTGTSTSSRGRGVERGRNTCNWVVLDDEAIAVSHLAWSADAGRFVETSRHRFPRRGRDPYALEVF